MAAVIDPAGIEKYCDAAGMRADHPLRAVLLSMAATTGILQESADKLQQTVETGGSTPAKDIERKLRLVAAESLRYAARTLVLGSRWVAIGVVTGAAVLALGVGYGGGWEAGYASAGRRSAWAATELQEAFRSGLPGAEWLAGVLPMNNLSELAKACRASSYVPSEGGSACVIYVRTALPPVAKGAKQ